jgi:hypothetical protein
MSVVAHARARTWTVSWAVARSAPCTRPLQLRWTDTRFPFRVIARAARCGAGSEVCFPGERRARGAREAGTARAASA